jgi:hypothetical protein
VGTIAPCKDECRNRSRVHAQTSSTTTSTCGLCFISLEQADSRQGRPSLVVRCSGGTLDDSP